MIQTVDNFIGIANNSKLSKPLDYGCIIEQKQNDIFVRLADYTNKSSNNTFFSFFDKDADKKQFKNADDLIISIAKNSNGLYQAQTGNYIGKFKYDGFDIDIKSRFSDKFLERMLNFANDVYLDDISLTGNETKKDEMDYSKFIIYYIFVQSLEKAYLLGLPKAYKSVQHHESTLKGKIDINRFIKEDIPFRGHISSVSREQKEIQEIIDVLYKAVKIISKVPKQKNATSYKGFLKNISHIVPHLKEQRSKNFVSNETISKAMRSKALQNPIFAPYKKVLRYAKYIIIANSIKENIEGKEQTFGFLVNVAELFEVYITKLLKKEFPAWNVESPKEWLYEGKFYARHIIPDIVMTLGKDMMVFDTKYKRMSMTGNNRFGAGDLDRNDFFQINTYMSYYQNHPEKYNVLVGGLLYPMDKFDQDQYHADSWFGNVNTKFIVDGIELLQENLSIENIVNAEIAFVKRVKNIINDVVYE